MNQNWLYEKWTLIPWRSKIGRVLFYLFTAWLAYLGIKNTIRDSTVSFALVLLSIILGYYFVYRKKWHDYRLIPPKLWTEDWVYQKWNLLPLRSKIGRVLYFANMIWVGALAIDELIHSKKIDFHTSIFIGLTAGYFIHRSEWRAKQRSAEPTPEESPKT